MKFGRLAMAAALCVWAASGVEQTFEVASVKALGRLPGMEQVKWNPLRISIHNTLLVECISRAYGVTKEQISGPSWMRSEKFDIDAKLAAPASESEIRQMLQALLAERFKLAFHRETRTLPLYELTVGPKGSKLAVSKDEESELRIGPNKFTPTFYEYHGVTMDEFAVLVKSTSLDHDVVNLTGLSGRYDAKISFQAGTRPAPSSQGDSIMDLLEPQLGLRLVLRNAPREVLVIDRAEPVPVEN